MRFAEQFTLRRLVRLNGFCALLSFGAADFVLAQEPLPFPPAPRSEIIVAPPVLKPTAEETVVISPAAAAGAESGGTTARSSEKSLSSADGVMGNASGMDNAKAFTAGWKDGFIVQSDDDQFKLRLTGQIQADYRLFARDHDITDVDTFLLRRARLGIEANMLKYYEFRLLPDFGQSTVVIQDAYLNVHYVDYFQFEAGRFKQPFSYEQLIQDRFVPTLERSLIDQLVPSRDEGVMVHGQNLFCNRLDYAVALSNGEINGNIDTNNHKDFNGRLAVRPFGDPESPLALQNLQIGCSAGIGTEQEAVNPATLRTPATVPWFTFNAAVRADGQRTRYSPEITYFYKALGFAAQYYRQDQQFVANAGGSAVDRNLSSEGFYVLATYLLTGEERTSYSQAVKPLRPFDPHCASTATGAWEMVARVSRLDVNRTAFSPGVARLADPTRSSAGATESTLGFNWYLNAWARAQFNWEHAWFDDPVLLGRAGATGMFREMDSLVGRFQIIF